MRTPIAAAGFEPRAERLRYHRGTLAVEPPPRRAEMIAGSARSPCNPTARAHVALYAVQSAHRPYPGYEPKAKKSVDGSSAEAEEE
jgi:hypothetical protein